MLSLTEFFGIPFNMPQPIQTATVATSGSNLNIRVLPSTDSAIKGKVPNGAEILIYNRLPDWDLIGYNGTVGYVSNRYVLL